MKNMFVSHSQKLFLPMCEQKTDVKLDKMMTYFIVHQWKKTAKETSTAASTLHLKVECND